MIYLTYINQIAEHERVRSCDPLCAGSTAAASCLVSWINHGSSSWQVSGVSSDVPTSDPSQWWQWADSAFQYFIVIYRWVKIEPQHASCWQFVRLHLLPLWLIWYRFVALDCSVLDFDLHPWWAISVKHLAVTIYLPCVRRMHLCTLKTGLPSECPIFPGCQWSFIPSCPGSYY